jgi:vesicle transport through interaction with t-SNAREs protein 1
MADDAAFYGFLSEFRTLSSTLSSQLSNLPSLPTIDQQRAALSAAEQTADELSTSVSIIEPDIRHYHYASRVKAQQQLSECQTQLEAQQATLAQYAQSIRNNRQLTSNAPRTELLGSNGSAGGRSRGEQRHLLLSSRAVLQDGDESLDNTQRMLAEAAQVGAETSGKLVEQREQFGAQIRTLDDTHYSLRQSKRTLRSMAFRVLTNKLISAAIILALIALFVLSAYLKYFR